MSDYNSEKNRFVWMDVCVEDLDRACAFYEGVLNCSVNKESFDGFEFAILDHEDGNGGCLIPRGEGITPCANGIMVYLNTDGRIKDACTKVVELGGKIVMETHPIGPHGFRAMIEDSEGNSFALHSNTDA